MADGREIVIEFVHERNARRNVYADNFVVRNMIQVFDEGSQAVAMGRNQDTLTRSDHRSNRLGPVGKDAIDGVFQTFRQRSLAGVQGRVSGIMLRTSWIVES